MANCIKRSDSFWLEGEKKKDGGRLAYNLTIGFISASFNDCGTKYKT